MDGRTDGLNEDDECRVCGVGLGEDKSGAGRVRGGRPEG